MNDQEQQITTIEPQFKMNQSPAQIIEEAGIAAKMLMELVRQNNWSKKIGQGEHLELEAWLTLGKFYGLTARTKEGSVKHVEFGKAQGFEAYSEIVDTKTGFVVGGAESMCLDDEANWRNKPLFTLKSMAQTRAAGKAFRQMLSWVVVLAGFRPTPAEEMSHLQGNSQSDSQEAIKQMQDAKRNSFNKEPEWIEGKVANENISDDDMQRIASEVDPLADKSECSNCHVKAVPQKVIDYSNGKYGRTLCFNCQKTAV